MSKENAVDVSEMLQLQLAEVEMLTSMFPKPEEMLMDDPTSIAEIQNFLDGNISYDLLQCRIGFVVHMSFAKSALEMVCHLPHEYPASPPEVFIRCADLSRHQHRQLSEDLQSYILALDRGEICLCFIIQWLQDSVDGYLKASRDELENQARSSAKSEKVTRYDGTFSRMWIYSHHIYSKIKRKAILDYSEELQLTGFCMPGKPGIICIEGYSCMVEDFWHRIRRMQWKHLAMKDREDTEIGDKSVEDYRKFGKLEEQYFDPRQGKGRGAHSDRGLLFQYLVQHGCGHVFQVYFGVEGKGVVENEDSD